MGITAALLEYALNLIDKIGYLGLILILVLDNAGIPIPSEATLALAGNLSRSGEFNIFLVIIIGTLAQTAGTYLAYIIGEYGGVPLVKKYGKYILISSHDYDKAEAWFKRRGEGAILLSRFTPVVRTFAGFVAGTFKMNKWLFIRDSFIGSFIWTVAFTVIGYIFGDSWKKFYSYLHYLDYLVVAIVVVLIVRYVLKKKRKLSK